ncbi:MAG: DNA-processing protein DprA [Vicinamibacterales bacterium]
MSRLLDFVALSLTPFSWRRGIGGRLRSGEPPDSLIAALAPGTSEARATLARLPGAARAVLERADRTGIGLVVWGDADFPPALSAIDDPPPVLWFRGDRDALRLPAVALVGSRAGSPCAVAVAEQLAAELAAHQVVIVSGLARGVDSAAHRGALQSGGPTMAVLGSGVDVVYPPEHRRLAATIARTPACAVVSELAPGTRPLRWFFPLRNRIISGLSQAVVVVEAGEKSGSLITARTALDQGREVLAVPGAVLGGRNRGGHALIRDGAKIVECADDILEELRLPERFTPARPGAPVRAAGDRHDPVLAVLAPGEPRDLDAIAAESGLPADRLLPRLFELELQGHLRRAGGGRFIRVDRSC